VVAAAVVVALAVCNAPCVFIVVCLAVVVAVALFGVHWLLSVGPLASARPAASKHAHAKAPLTHFRKGQGLCECKHTPQLPMSVTICLRFPAPSLQGCAGQSPKTKTAQHFQKIIKTAAA